MKNLLIAGVAKSGKSTICEKICEEEKYNHIPFDYITASMKRNYPEWGVKSDGQERIHEHPGGEVPVCRSGRPDPRQKVRYQAHRLFQGRVAALLPQ